MKNSIYTKSKKLVNNEICSDSVLCCKSCGCKQQGLEKQRIKLLKKQWRAQKGSESQSTWGLWLIMDNVNQFEMGMVGHNRHQVKENY